MLSQYLDVLRAEHAANGGHGDLKAMFLLLGYVLRGPE